MHFSKKIVMRGFKEELSIFIVHTYVAWDLCTPRMVGWPLLAAIGRLKSVHYKQGCICLESTTETLLVYPLDPTR